MLTHLHSVERCKKSLGYRLAPESNQAQNSAEILLPWQLDETTFPTRVTRVSLSPLCKKRCREPTSSLYCLGHRKMAEIMEW